MRLVTVIGAAVLLTWPPPPRSNRGASRGAVTAPSGAADPGVEVLFLRGVCEAQAQVSGGENSCD